MTSSQVQPKIPSHMLAYSSVLRGLCLLSGLISQVRVERRQVEVLGRRVTYKVSGPASADPVILVHGLAGSTRWWAKTIPALAREYRVYMVDLPGFGSMRHFPGGFVLEDAASWLVAWMQALGLQRAHLVGHSMGGYISLKVAAHHPEAVNCLVLVDPAGVPSGRPVHGHILPLMSQSIFSGPRLLPIMLRDALRAGPRTIWRASTDLLSRDVREDLHVVHAPTLLIWGEKDPLVPVFLGHVLRREIHGSRLYIVKGARHVPMLEKPRQFNRALLAFFSGLPVGE